MYVGTSGWVYDWNPDGLDWYAAHSGLNAVELNASFYRFPSRRTIESWARRGSRLRWAVKVHRSVTHVHRLNEKGLEAMRRFLELFKPMDHLIDYYLAQLPPSYRDTPENRRRVARLAAETGLGERLAVEFRHESWFKPETIEWAEKLGITLVSIDAPIGTWIASTHGRIYLRLHGRTAWYAHDYTDEELTELAAEVARHRPRLLHVFFNNNHWMLDNARRMKEILEHLLCNP